MPLLVHAIDLPADVVEVRAADAGADGVDELLLVSAHHAGRRPDAITLTVVDVAPDGVPSVLASHPLGRTPYLWDAGPGLWLLGPKGASDLLTPATKRLALPTALAWMGPSTPRQADLLTDLDHDGSPELLAYSTEGRGGLVLVDLASRTSYPLRAGQTGLLSTTDDHGGQQVSLSVRWPRTKVADIDGDGVDDIVLVNGNSLRVWRGQAGTAPAEPISISLPVDIDPWEDPTLPHDADRRPVEGVWLEDVDGDAKADLVVHRAVLEGSWMGATAELLFMKGTGTAFSEPRSIATEALAVEVVLEDVDSDGDKDLVVPQVDITLSNMARALVARKMQVDVTLHRFEDGAFASESVLLHPLVLPIEDHETVHVEFADDMTGDGISDMVYQVADGPLTVYAGSLEGISDTPWATADVPVPPGEDTVFVHDLTGDGAPELVVWKAGGTTAHIATPTP